MPAVVDLGDDARRRRRARRRSEARQPAAVGRARHRPLGAGRLLRPVDRLRAEQPARISAQPRALHLPALGPERLQQLPRRPARDRHRPPGERRVPRPRRLPRDARRRPAGVPGHAGRHRLAHDDGQRARRRRLGRRRHRGGGRDARPAGLDADPRGPRRAAQGQAARGRHRHRPRADRHRAPAQAGRRRQVRRVLRPGHGVADRRRPRHPRQHGARVRRDHRHLPDRRDDARLPAPHRPPGGRHRAGRGVHQGAGPVPHRPDAGSDLRHGDRRRSRRRSCPASPARAGRRIACR